MIHRSQIKVFRLSGPLAVLMIPVMLALLLPVLALLLAATIVTAVVPGLALPSRIFRKFIALGGSNPSSAIDGMTADRSAQEKSERKLPDIEVEGRRLP